MPRFTHQNPDGKFVHGCTDCGQAIVNGHRYCAWICKCKTPQTVQGPTVTIGQRPATTTPKAKPARFKFAVPPCAYLGPEVGEPIKISCGGVWKRAKECYCPDRPQWVSSRDGEAFPNKAADVWWCSDLGPMTAKRPRVIASCQACPHRTPQLLLPAPPGSP